MVGSIVCPDMERLLDYGFKCNERGNGIKFYTWVANGVHDGHIDICVYEYSYKSNTGWYDFHKLNKLSILPKLIQLANAGLCINYEL